MTNKESTISNIFTGFEVLKINWVKTKNGIKPIFTRIEQTTLDEFMDT